MKKFFFFHLMHSSALKISLSLSQGVLNFVQYKFSHLAPKERQTMYELSKMFLLCLNYWKLVYLRDITMIPF